MKEEAEGKVTELGALLREGSYDYTDYLSKQKSSVPYSYSGISKLIEKVDLNEVPPELLMEILHEVSEADRDRAMYAAISKKEKTRGFVAILSGSLSVFL